MPRDRIAWVTLPDPSYGDVGQFAATIVPHQYLQCMCGLMLWHGRTTTDAPIYACRRCQKVADCRRVA